MSRVDVMDLADHLLTVLEAELRTTREYGDEVLHSFALPGTGARVLVGGRLDDAHEGRRRGWIGADVGRYAITPQLFDAVADAREEVRSLTTFSKAIRRGSIRLWVCQDVEAETLSIDVLHAAVAASQADARRVRQRLRDESPPAPARGLQVDLGAMESLWRRDVARGGHDLWDFPTQAFLGRPFEPRWRWALDPSSVDGRSRGRRIESSPWPVPLMRYTLDEATWWLEARYPPECLHLDILDGRALATGALGVVAFAIEDRYDVEAGLLRLLTDEASPTLLDLVADRLLTFAKLGPFAERRGVMPRREFGWLRPFTVTASSLTGQTAVRVWNRESERMERDDELSSACAEFVRDPERSGVPMGLFEARLRRALGDSAW